MTLGPKWAAFFFFLWIFVQMICLMSEGAWTGDKETGLVNDFMELKVFTSTSTFGKILGIFDPQLYTTMLNMATFQYDIFYGNWAIFQWCILLPLTCVMIYCLVSEAMSLVRGTG